MSWVLFSDLNYYEIGFPYLINQEYQDDRVLLRWDICSLFNKDQNFGVPWTLIIDP